MDLNWLSAMLVGAGCLTLGYCFGTRRPSFIFVRLTPKVVKYTKTNPSSHHGNKKNKSKEPFEIDKLADILDDFKMLELFDMVSLDYLVLQNLGCKSALLDPVENHATLGLYKMLLNRAPTALNRWEMCAQPKMVVKIESEEDMLVLQVILRLEEFSFILVSTVFLDGKFRFLSELLIRLSWIIAQFTMPTLVFTSATLQPGGFSAERAKSLKLPTHITIDAGRTQIAPNSRTVMAILGKSFRSRPVEVVDEVTGGLKLL
ncbi:hypothetical protein SADUNF_Sadunf19G0061300 [Salix dunnii]|uniref:peptidyl-tRNA hydrolase n=1 Tax=Salix dunnii TaxID=1413687 RepID=A0A835J1H3_9ROSI|nr:hypothetical protein SADUNF_Sadunf19G0061300 [Salix dunnii]